MKRNTIALIIFTAFSQITFGQDVYDKIARKLCKCLEKEEVTDMKNDHECLERILFDNMNDLIEYHELESISDFNPTEFSGALIGRMAKDCVYLLNLYGDSIKKTNPQFTPDVAPECVDIHVGEFYYVQINPETKISDTTYATFTETEYFERMNEGKTYSRLSLSWLSDCKFELNFIESNDPFKKSLSKPGDTYNYEIKKVTKNGFIAQFFWEGPEVFLEYKRLE